MIRVGTSRTRQIIIAKISIIFCIVCCCWLRYKHLVFQNNGNILSLWKKETIFIFAEQLSILIKSNRYYNGSINNSINGNLETISITTQITWITMMIKTRSKMTTLNNNRVNMHIVDKKWNRIFENSTCNNL